MGSQNLANRLNPKKLDKTIAEKAAKHSADFYLNDGGGLFLRVYPSGKRTFVYRFEVDGKTRKVEHEKPYGAGPDQLTLAAARLWRAEQHALRLAGRDPVEAKRGVRSLRRLQLTEGGDYPPGTFGALALEFHARIIAKDYQDPTQFLALLKRDLLPTLGRRPIADVRLAEVQQVLNKIVDRGSKVAANRALLAAKKVFRYARTQGHIELNPLGDISRRDVGGKEGERDRALSFEEIPLFWRTVGTAPRLSWQVRACLKFLLLTGQRIGETMAATWGQIDLEGGVWRIPAENTKTKKAHLVHLGPTALALLGTLPRAKKGPGWLFHDATDDAAEPITRRAVTRALDRLLTPAGKEKKPTLPLAAFTPHDLRRTMRSRLSDLGVLPHVAEKILNHALGGVLQVYDRGEYLEERAAAVAKWDAKLRELIGG